LKEALRGALAKETALQCKDLGVYNSETAVDYPEVVPSVVYAMREAAKDGGAACGILVCGSGIGISMVANRFAGTRAALCCTTEMAQLARQHNDANVLALGARLTDPETAMQMLRVFLTTSFEGGRHARRVQKMDALVRELNPTSKNDGIT
jgi:ribose 5-phosphate isomerase B